MIHNDNTPNSFRMTAQELKSTLSLSSIFALRMFGLFIILPVFAVYAASLPGGDDEFAVGLTLGIYGLAQGLLQIPFGAASDKFGRRPVIIAGLLIFAAGSFIAATAEDISMICLGRAVQGAGAVSAAVTAAVADNVRAQVVTKAMAFIGASIGITFAASMVAAAPLAEIAGVPGLFVITGALALIAVLAALMIPFAKPRENSVGEKTSKCSWRRILFDPQLLRLNFGVFTLHAALTSIFVVIPERLVHMGLPVSDHWHLYLPAVLVGFALMVKPISWASRRGATARLQQMLTALLAVVFMLFSVLLHSVWETAFLLALFFSCFNILEATLPGLASRCAPEEGRGLALGIFNTTQNLGLFAGGIAGGWIDQHFSAEAVFICASFAMLIWFASAIGLKEPMRRHHHSGDALNV